MCRFLRDGLWKRLLTKQAFSWTRPFVAAVLKSAWPRCVMLYNVVGSP